MISLIVAIGVHNLIGKDNALPWHYSEDLQYFRKTTSNKKVLMGEQTFYSIGKPLPKRQNVVATLDKNFSHEGVEVTNDLIGYLKQHENDEEDIFVIGGKQIYALALPYCKKLYITHVSKEYEGNVFFPEINYALYEKEVVKTAQDLEFAVYTKKE